jgi:hypothetical protein
MALTLASSADLPAADPKSFAELTVNSRNDHGACCPTCHASAMAGVLVNEYRFNEAQALSRYAKVLLQN